MSAATQLINELRSVNEKKYDFREIDFDMEPEDIHRWVDDHPSGQYPMVNYTFDSFFVEAEDEFQEEVEALKRGDRIAVKWRWSGDGNVIDFDTEWKIKSVKRHKNNEYEIRIDMIEVEIQDEEN